MNDDNIPRMPYRMRRVLGILFLIIATGITLIINPKNYEATASLVDGPATHTAEQPINDDTLAINLLSKIEIKGRAPKTGYTREEFYKGWPTVDGCNLRQKIIRREFGESAVMDECNVVSGEFVEPYTGKTMTFAEKSEISKGLQIDHVVALSDAWQKGAQYMTKEIRYEIATDPLNLLAVDASANQQKSDSDAATWLPPNKSFRCQYVARQISVKYKYTLWMTQAEHDAIYKILESCPNEPTIGI